MRGVQRGLTTTFIVLVILAGTIVITSIYINYYLSQKQKAAEINSFEDCAKVYPVMESYPEQCATPDGKHFTRELSEKELPRVGAPSAISQNSDETANWNVYSNSVIGLTLKYPPGWTVTEEYEGKQVGLFSPEANEYMPDVNITYVENTPHSENPDYKNMTDPEVIYIDGYRASIRKDKDDGGLPRAGGFGFIQDVEVEYGPNLLYLNADRDSVVFPKILESIKLN